MNNEPETTTATEQAPAKAPRKPRAPRAAKPPARKHKAPAPVPPGHCHLTFRTLIAPEARAEMRASLKAKQTELESLRVAIRNLKRDIGRKQIVKRVVARWDQERNVVEDVLHQSIPYPLISPPQMARLAAAAQKAPKA
jgi:hypothetical protein